MLGGRHIAHYAYGYPCRPQKQEAAVCGNTGFIPLNAGNLVRGEPAAIGLTQHAHLHRQISGHHTGELWSDQFFLSFDLFPVPDID